MSLYKSWFQKAYTRDGNINNILWNDFMPREQKIYEHVISNKITNLSGTISELATKFEVEPIYIMGFIDGINDCLDEKIDVEKLSEDSNVELKITFENLYKKMIEYKADHLFNLPEWKQIFTDEQLNILYKGQRSSKTFIREAKIERNDPCPCSSGKKYKICCGKN